MLTDHSHFNPQHHKYNSQNTYNFNTVLDKSFCLKLNITGNWNKSSAIFTVSFFLYECFKKDIKKQ